MIFVIHLLSLCALVSAEAEDNTASFGGEDFFKSCYARNLTELQNIECGWKTVEDNVDFDFEVQKTPLEIKTNAEPGSDKMLRVWFETADGIYAGGVRISFNPTPQYFLPTCMSLSEFVEFPVEIPSTTYKVWRVTVNRTKKDVQIVLHCNGQLVLNVQLSDVCTYTTWRKNWVPSSLIKFHHDDSSQMFRAYTVDGGWSKFSSWSECSAECGGGTQTRTRSCTNPAPAENGVDCFGKSTETRSCNNQECPIDGGWSEVSSWSECTTECGGGTQTRTRSCTNPAPAYGASECTGESTESRSCNNQKCPVSCPAGSYFSPDLEEPDCQECGGNTVSTEGADVCTACNEGYDSVASRTKCGKWTPYAYDNNRGTEKEKFCPDGKFVTKLTWYSKHNYGLVDVKIECGDDFSTRLTNADGNADTSKVCDKGIAAIDGRYQHNYGIINARAKCRGDANWSDSNKNFQGEWTGWDSCSSGVIDGIAVREEGCCGIITYKFRCAVLPQAVWTQLSNDNMNGDPRRQSCPEGKFVTKLTWYSQHKYGLIDVKLECGDDFSVRLTNNNNGNADSSRVCDKGISGVEGHYQDNYGIINARAKCSGDPNWSDSNTNFQGDWQGWLDCPVGVMTGVEVREEGCCGIVNFQIVCSLLN